jgi:hypothetical protein
MRSVRKVEVAWISQIRSISIIGRFLKSLFPFRCAVQLHALKPSRAPPRAIMKEPVRHNGIFQRVLIPMPILSHKTQTKASQRYLQHQNAMPQAQPVVNPYNRYVSKQSTFPLSSASGASLAASIINISSPSNSQLVTEPSGPAPAPAPAPAPSPSPFPRLQNPRESD